MSDDVLITRPAARLSSRIMLAMLTARLNLTETATNITSPGGDIGLGDPTADVFIVTHKQRRHRVRAERRNSCAYR